MENNIKKLSKNQQRRIRRKADMMEARRVSTNNAEQRRKASLPQCYSNQ